MTRQEVAKAERRRFWMGWPRRLMVLVGQVVTWGMFSPWGALAACAEGRERDLSSGTPRTLAPALSVSFPISCPWNLCQERWERGVGAGGSPSPQHAHTYCNSLPQSCLGVSAWTLVTPQSKQDPRWLGWVFQRPWSEVPSATQAASPVCSRWWVVTTPKLPATCVCPTC